MKEMAKLQLIKIEELTLYTIEQQKEIDEIREQLKKLLQERQALKQRILNKE